MWSLESVLTHKLKLSVSEIILNLLARNELTSGFTASGSYLEIHVGIGEFRRIMSLSFSEVNLLLETLENPLEYNNQVQHSTIIRINQTHTTSRHVFITRCEETASYVIRQEIIRTDFENTPHKSSLDVSELDLAAFVESLNKVVSLVHLGTRCRTAYVKHSYSKLCSATVRSWPIPKEIISEKDRAMRLALAVSAWAASNGVNIAHALQRVEFFVGRPDLEQLTEMFATLCETDHLQSLVCESEQAGLAFALTNHGSMPADNVTVECTEKV